MMHSVRTFSIMRVVGVKAYRYQRDSKLWKSFIHRKRFRKWLLGGCIPLILPPMDASLVICYRNHQKSLAYFSHLAPLVLFFFTKRPSQKMGAMAQWANAPLKTLLHRPYQLSSHSRFYRDISEYCTINMGQK